MGHCFYLLLRRTTDSTKVIIFTIHFPCSNCVLPIIKKSVWLGLARWLLQVEFQMISAYQSNLLSYADLGYIFIWNQILLTKYGFILLVVNEYMYVHYVIVISSTFCVRVSLSFTHLQMIFTQMIRWFNKVHSGC